MGNREMDDAKKLKPLRAKENNPKSRVYMVDGKPLKFISKKSKETVLGAGITMEDAEGVVCNKNFPCLGSNKSDSVSPNRQVTLSPIVKVHEYVSKFNTSAATDKPSDSFKTINKDGNANVLDARAFAIRTDGGNPSVKSSFADKNVIRTDMGSKEVGSGVMNLDVKPTNGTDAGFNQNDGANMFEAESSKLNIERASTNEWDTFVENHSHVFSMGVIDGENMKDSSILHANENQDQSHEKHESPCNKSYSDLFNDGSSQDINKVSSNMNDGSDSYETSSDEGNKITKRVDFRALVNMEMVENADTVLLMSAIEKVKNRFENNLVGFFVGKSVVFQIVQNYVKNTWTQFGLQNLMKNDDEVFLFKFKANDGLEKVLKRGPW
ncbi:ribonuclease H-like domain-containing protein, partial [Tanacetum coccineum]